VTDKLRSYPVAYREVMPEAIHAAYFCDLEGLTWWVWFITLVPTFRRCTPTSSIAGARSGNPGPGRPGEFCHGGLLLGAF